MLCQCKNSYVHDPSAQNQSHHKLFKKLDKAIFLVREKRMRFKLMVIAFIQIKVVDFFNVVKHKIV